MITTASDSEVNLLIIFTEVMFTLMDVYVYNRVTGKLSVKNTWTFWMPKMID